MSLGPPFETEGPPLRNQRGGLGPPFDKKTCRGLLQVVHFCIITFFLKATTQRAVQQQSSCWWAGFIACYAKTCRRTKYNTVSPEFSFQKRMIIKKDAIQRPYKYMWVVQLGRPHMFMQPLGRIFLYNIFFLQQQTQCVLPYLVSQSRSFI